MNTKPKYLIILMAIAALALPLSWASATTTLQFNNNPLDMVGSASETLSVTQGGTFTLSIQMNTTVGTNSLDYWLSQFSGPTGSNPFSIISRDLTASAFPDPTATNGQVTTTADNFNNNAFSSSGHPDGNPDNQLKSQNGPTLGAVAADTTMNNPTGINQVATFTIQVASTAALGTYELRSFNYSGTGWGSTTLADQPFDAEARIFVSVVPEPATWSLLGLGALGALGLNVLRARRRLS